MTNLFTPPSTSECLSVKAKNEFAFSFCKIVCNFFCFRLTLVWYRKNEVFDSLTLTYVNVRSKCLRFAIIFIGKGVNTLIAASYEWLAW